MTLAEHSATHDRNVAHAMENREPKYVDAVEFVSNFPQATPTDQT